MQRAERFGSWVGQWSIEQRVLGGFGLVFLGILVISIMSYAQVDRARFDAWLRQLLVDASAGADADVAGDVSTLEWIRDRFAHSLRSERRARLDTLLVELRETVRDGDLKAAAELAAELRGQL